MSITSDQLIDALVILKTEQSKMECHKNLTKSLEKAKKQYHKRVAKVNLIEVNENGVIKKIMFPAGAIVNSQKKITSNKNSKTNLESTKVPHNVTVRNSKTVTQITDESIHVSTSNSTSAPKMHTLVRCPLTSSLNTKPTEVVNNSLALVNLNNFSSHPNISQSFLINQNQTINKNQVISSNQIMLQQTPIFINQPLANSVFKPNLVIQQQIGHQVLQLQSGQNFVDNNCNNLFLKNNILVQAQNGQRFVQFQSNNNNNNVNTTQYQILGNQQCVLNFKQNFNNFASVPLLIRPHTVNNTVLMPSLQQKPLNLDQLNSVTAQKILQPTTNYIPANNVYGQNTNINQTNNIIVSYPSFNSPQTMIVKPVTYLCSSSAQTNNSSNTDNVIKNQFFNATISNAINDLSIKNKTGKIIIRFNNNINNEEGEIVLNKTNNKNAFQSLTNKNFKTKNFKMSKSNVQSITLKNNNNRTFKSKNINAGKNSKSCKNSFHLLPRKNESFQNVPEFFQKSSSLQKCLINDKVENLHVPISNLSTSTESKIQSLNSSTPIIIDQVNNDDKIPILSKQVSVVILNQNGVQLKPHLKNYSRTGSSNTHYNVASSKNVKRKIIDKSKEEGKRLKALSSYRIIKPKPNNLSVTENNSIENTLSANMQDENKVQDIESGSTNLEDFSKKQKINSHLDNDLAIARLLSKEVNSDDEEDDFLEGKIKGNRKNSVNDKSYKCKKTNFKSFNNNYPRTRSATKRI